MKWLGMWVMVLSGLLLNVAQAESIPPVVIFHCDLNDGNWLQVTRNPMTDVFVLSYGNNISKPNVKITRLGNNLGTSVHYTSSDTAYGREVYFMYGKEFYTVGFVDKSGNKSGYLHVTRGTEEINYQECTSESVQSMFDNESLFRSLTDVD